MFSNLLNVDVYKLYLSKYGKLRNLFKGKIINIQEKMLNSITGSIPSNENDQADYSPTTRFTYPKMTFQNSSPGRSSFCKPESPTLSRSKTINSMIRHSNQSLYGKTPIKTNHQNHHRIIDFSNNEDLEVL